jgi:hypothetical protein
MIVVFICGNLTCTFWSGICIFAAREVKEGILFGNKSHYNREAVLFSSLLFSSLLFSSLLYHPYPSIQRRRYIKFGFGYEKKKKWKRAEETFAKGKMICRGCHHRFFDFELVNVIHEKGKNKKNLSRDLAVKC